MDTEAQAVDRAISKLFEKSIFKRGDSEFEVRSLVPTAKWRPIAAEWWKKKEACVIGEDSCGNLYLRMCDGTVRFWDHETENDEILAPSVRAFLLALEAPTPVKLKPGQVRTSWIDPAFLEKWKKKDET